MSEIFNPATEEGAVPLPVLGRDGHLGGIESIVLDGVTYYFGFDYSSDLVVSPLIADIDVIATFAARHMVQRDGAHDAAYWRELAGYDSELCSSEESRTFTTAGLTSVVSSLRRAAREDAMAAEFAIEYHLRYLLGAAGGWVEGGGDRFEAVDEQIAFLRGEERLPEGAHYAVIARELQAHLDALLDAAPENWRTHFRVLKSATMMWRS
jgi:hypothetical protein